MELLPHLLNSSPSTGVVQQWTQIPREVLSSASLAAFKKWLGERFLGMLD